MHCGSSGENEAYGYIFAKSGRADVHALDVERHDRAEAASNAVPDSSGCPGRRAEHATEKSIVEVVHGRKRVFVANDSLVSKSTKLAGLRVSVGLDDFIGDE